MNTPIPLKGQKILLRGFDPTGEAEAKALLVQRGYHIVSSIALADSLLLGATPTNQVIEAAKKAQIKVVAWEELRALMADSAPAPAVASGPCRATHEVGVDFVRILDQVLPKLASAHPLTPAAECFRHLCFDGGFLRTARAVALGISHRLPVAMEGETAASKTTAILWVAHLLGQPVVRLNMHGQTDTGELLGRYVPCESSRSRHAGQPVCRALAPEAARSAAREASWDIDEESSTWSKQGLFSTESQESSTSWRFQEGFIPQAMRHGWWVILDEMNLAEPQVLERLNSVIEQPSSLVLTEGAGDIFGASGTVRVAEGFHMFATMNPADYAGRSVLSPAFRDRWLLWHQADAPGESELTAMLHCMVHGQQPEFEFNGALYQAPATTPFHSRLGTIPGISSLLAGLASFHVSLSQSSGMDGGMPAMGRLRRERYVFTRRTLLTCLQLFSQARAANPTASPSRQLCQAIEITYLGRLRGGADRNAAVSLLRAAGLAESCDLPNSTH